MIFIENRFGEKPFSERFFPENSFIILVKTSSEPVLRSTFSALLILVYNKINEKSIY